MRQPAPAATSAAVVETLKVGRPPPVPAVSTSTPSTSTGTAKLAHRARQAGDLGDGLALRAQRDQEGGGLRLRRGAVHDHREHRGGLVGAQVLAGGDAVDRGGQRRLRHRGSCASSALPSPVSTDSGWNCTPSAGSSRVAQAHDHVARARGDLERVGQLPDRRSASGSDRPRAEIRGRRRSSCRRARPRRSCRAPARRARPCRRRPSPAPGDRGRRRAPAPRPRRSCRIASHGHARLAPACTARARRSPGPGWRSSSSSTSLRTTSSSAPSSPRYWTRL